MASPRSNHSSNIIRTERGLTIAGSRVTLYDLMDYVTAQYPPKFISAMLSLTNEQINMALSYIEEHRADIEAEYQQVLEETEKLQKYWEEQNSGLFTRIAAKPPKSGTEAIKAKLKVAREQLKSKA